MNLNEYTHLTPGSKVPVYCCKSSKKTAAVFRDEHSVRFWCARCGHTEVLRTHRVLNWIKKLAPDFLGGQRKEIVPPDCTQELSKECLAWLGKYGVSGDTAVKYGVRYSDMMQRCMLPVFDKDGKIICAQFRALRPEQTPKYLTSSTTKDALWFSSFIKEPKALVITEDILSAIKINHCVPSVSTCCIMGTSFTTEKVFKILNTLNPRRVILWMDGDSAGEKAVHDGLKKFRLQGANVCFIKTPEDPKELSKAQIQSILTSGVFIA